jgi:hypothetical protein
VICGCNTEDTEAVYHISGSRGGIAGVYPRHHRADEKCAALGAWAAHILVIVDGRAIRPNVGAMTGRASSPTVTAP